MSETQAAESPTEETSRQKPVWWRLLDAAAILAMLPSFVAGTARWWWIGDLCCHFRLYYALALGFLLIAFLVMRRWRWAVPIGAVLGVNTLLLWPLLAPRTAASSSGESVRLMVANVFIGNIDATPVLSAVQEADPDVLLLIEVDERWLDDVSELKEEYPHVVTAVRDEGYEDFGPFGMAVFSRLPLRESSVRKIGSVNLPAIVATVECEETEWFVIAGHPYPPVSAACSTVRNSYLNDLGDLLGESESPKVLVGDLNVTRWSPHFAKLLRHGGVRDSSRGFGYQPTWPDWLPLCLIPIDHVLISPDVTVVSRTVGPSIGSDHRPLIIDIQLRPDSDVGSE